MANGPTRPDLDEQQETLFRTEVSGINYSVVCGISVKNLTDLNLTDPEVCMNWGYVEYSPPSIPPAKWGTMVARKSGYTATGNSGTVSWLLGDTENRLVVMWSAPFNFVFYCNYLAVGVARDQDLRTMPSSDTLFNQMYYKDPRLNGGWFVRKKFARNISQISLNKEGFNVRAIMGDSHKTVAQITIEREIV